MCRCGHHAQSHSTQIPNKCSLCDLCPCFTPFMRTSRRTGKIKAKFDGTCHICKKPITSSKDDIIRQGPDWVHVKCS